MPAPTYYQPIEKILNGKCEYEYYSHTTDKFDKTERTRICHVKLRETGGYNSDIAMLIFTIRNQNGAWKIHSEGVRRTDPGSMVPLRNATVKLAKEKGWKFIAVAVAPEDTPATENISQYVISIESYTYGDETVGVLTEALQHLNALGNPDFYRTKTTLGTHEYSLAFIKKEKLIDYISLFDNRVESDLINEVSNAIVKDEEILAHNLYGMHIKLQNDALADTNPHICIGWSKMGDLSNITTREELDERYETAYPNEKIRKKAQDIGQIWRFVKEMQIGDYVVFSNGDTCHIGRIVSNYYFDNIENDNQDSDYVNTRDVEWIKKDIRKSDLSEVFQNSLGAAMSVFRLNDYKSVICDLLNDTYQKDDISVDDYIGIVPEVISSNLSIADLGRILADMYNNASAGNQSNAIRMFGIKYGGVITENGYSAVAIVKASGINSSYDAEVSKGISIYKSIRDNEYGIHFVNEDTETSDVNDTKVLGGYNKIYYGAPGCGKSFIVNKMLDDANVPDVNRIRVTFHPEYANCDFVGQILPTIETQVDTVTGEEKEVVKYIFNPGPFTLALERARKTNDMVYLVIEEINRGNAAAIFGDLFQLLDREKDMTKSNWGESEYPICNVNIQKYLGMGEGKSTIIPSNLTILATMNTSDQSVFTLDTAFKRRWSFEQISNNVEKDTDHKYKGWYVPGTNVTLEKFLTVINAEILKHKITSEDKRMGKYFISKDCLTETPCEIQDVKMEAEMFAYKVLEYIWNDVCKIGKDEWFDTISITTLEDLIDAFVEPEDGANPLSIFKSITF